MTRLSPLLTQATGVTAVKGEGVYLFDAEGRRYLDFTSGIGVTNTGHCHPAVVEAAQHQTGELIHGQYTTVLHPALLELTARLGDVLPPGLDSLFFTSAGTEAVEAATRLAKQTTGRTNLIVFQGSFHGRTTAALSMTTSKAAYRAGLQPLMAGVFVAPFPYAYRYGWDENTTTEFALRELDYLFATQSAPRETAAIVVEPVLGEGGYVPATPGFLEGLRERCDRHSILLVIDEVQTGFGRTGRFWGHEHYNVHPDVLVTAKGLASGFPLSAIAASTELMERAWAGSQGGTYGGNAVACAAAVATLDVIEKEGLVENAATLGAHLMDALRVLQQRYPVIGDVRGKGLMVATEFTTRGEPDATRAKHMQAAVERRRLLMLTCGPLGNVIRWIPPLIVTREQIDQALGIFEEALASTAEEER
jgi:4-aminobutyrate aminotransferase